MYTDFFELEEKPFNLTPDPSFFFLSETHKEALDHLIYGINNREGFIMVTGDTGSGKTTLCRYFLEKMGPDIKTALVFNPMLTEKEFLSSILQDFGVDYMLSSQKHLIDKLNSFLLDQLEKDKEPALIIIDEAQDLTIRLMEQIRLLSNLETTKDKLIQIVLIGQNELRDKLSMPALRQLNQRITVHYELEYLDREETENYIYHRLAIAGAKGRIFFSPRAINKIFKYSKGVPRLINIAADRALLSGYTLSSHRITRKMVDWGIKCMKPRKGISIRRAWLN